MATTHFERTVFKRGSTKAGAAQRVAYIQREGIYDPNHVPAKARVDHLDKVFGEKLRDDLIDKDSHNLPSWAKGSPAAFFTAAEKYERANGTTYTEWKFSLPRELTREQQLAAAKDMMSTHFSDKHPYVWAMHEPTAHDGGKNPHTHVIWSSRTLDGIERSADQFFKRYNAAHPEKGGAQKSPELTAIGEAKRERTVYTDIMNAHLERAGAVERLHPDSHWARGLERTPEPRVLPSHSNKAKYQHEITDDWQRVLDSRAEREGHRTAEAANARDYWEARKHTLGIASGLSHDAALEHIAQAKGIHPARARTDEKTLRERSGALTTYVSDLEKEVTIGHARERTGRAPHPEQERRVDALLTRGEQFGIPAPVERKRTASKRKSLGRGIGDDASPQGWAKVTLKKDYDYERDDGIDISF